MEYDFSIIVLTYHPNFEKLKRTIYSVITQTFNNYEIIIADDGSSVDYFQEIEAWFKEKRFTAYRLVKNKKNVGTIKNLKSGLEVSNGKYIKALSPGDYLYNPDTLPRLYCFLQTGNKDVVFGKVSYYSKENNGNFLLYDKSAPQNLSVYRKNDMKKIKRNYLKYQDTIVGAGLCLKKEVWQPYIDYISKYIKYCEDASVVCMLADDCNISFWDEYIVWYEYGSGISTSENSKWYHIINGEFEKIYSELEKKYSWMKKKREFLYGGKSKNRYLGMFRKIFLSPPYIWFGIRNKIVKEKNKADITFLANLECDKESLKG